ncbi:CDP-diacylglycerol--serine O-phosphatidyltransferase [Pedobacter xixiisoli]|uniref:CDP-diacylglycerol--serine O-phosphatidyltransferase n=1 Tax=Pedobacter xixiisoli TaxID=1476464 RepID=A0A285ZP27_9SPHI|nr:CDP-diacylglycerol--serine O-phosphatidyltransferase [Pedobacter xixiisoli]SOD11413.1 CDP-diacylglycerol---serine O-phosphatidyltransferase [Pedobacter xixiisoli]
MLNLPNALTCANLFSGCIGIVFCFNGDLKSAAYFVILSGIFDFFDGMAARALKIKNSIGKDLDSLADVVSFGFLPGAIMFHLFKASDAPHQYLPYFAFIITLFSALRLAKFNNDTRQTVDFIGLNTPMNTLFIVSLPYVADYHPQVIGNWIVLAAISVVCSYLLISEIKIFSLKFSNFRWSENKIKFVFMILSIALFAWQQFVAIPIILLLYIGLSFVYFRNN